MLPQSWGSPDKGSQDYDPLLESALPPTLPKDDCATAPEEEDDSDNDSDDDQDVKDARTKRLGETKGWLGYLRDFAIFIPFVFPRKDIKIQICLLICIITFTLERAIQAIIPYTLGIIADKVTSRVAPTRELLIFFALDLASCESGLILIQNLSKIPALLDALVELLVPTTFLALAYIIIQRIVSGDAPPGDFVFFLRYWDAIVYPLRYLINHIHWLANDFVDAERLLILLKTKPTVTDVPEAFPLAVRGGNIQFKDVSFMYDEGHYALNNISFTASTGQTIAFVGETGAGKSSVLKLLMRLHDITSGRITIADQDIQKVTLSSLRDVMSVVPQTTMFFNTSIIDNVRYARSSATDEEVFKACRAAAIHDTIMRYPDGYSTQVGERGVKLSGGEAQRLAIARALLRDSPIVLLDEATSAVDTVTEGKIKGALEKLKRGRTVIVVAHRLSTIVDADQILVLHEGQILEKGRHQELCELRGKYWDLWERS
ncbi:P-loop containing nucleoside triphosphate hydrolase protein [Aureobasidium subglaciale]|nr:P-loop containing nucleoside triphosphate hydrolase protein [Aureobasidium subglaciale]